MTETFHEVSVTRSRRVRRCTWCAGKIEKKQADRKSERGKINLRQSACEILKPQD